MSNTAATQGVNRDERTSGRGYPLPHPDNTMQADIERLRTTLVAADADVTAQIAETRRRWVHDFIGLKL
ncbi:hypothetical protein GCM10011363_40420 [Marivita lacus]|uniref:Uncharacterized protein n=1 Tax=Marivita lacus TaxID=1323742 RepID=A0ABQ1L7E1_9RHOB|nr:hypothetical protein [Marivita lacus]GGC19632.1 hypothetical protein GCM10011363_40420 [Marivita lacus]